MKALKLLALAAVVVVSLSSCEEGPVGIFASIAGETDINALMTKEFENASPAFVVKADTTMYAGVGVLWSRPEGGRPWTRMDVSAVGSGTLFATSAAVVGTTLYATFTDTGTGADLGVWSWNGTSWNRVDAAFPAAGEELRCVLGANGQVFAVTALHAASDDSMDTTHSLYYLNGAAFATAGPADAAIGQPNSVAFDGTRYWFTAGPQVLTGTAASAIAVDATAPAADFGGVAYAAVPGETVFGTRSGVMYTVSGTTWSAASTAQTDLGGDAYAFYQPVYVSAGTAAILMPTRSWYRSSTDPAPPGGYLEFAATGFDVATATPNADRDLVSWPTNYAITLDKASIKSIVSLQEGTGTSLFALTDGNGLWSNYHDGSVWTGWRRE
ncbi:MAG: hypothetical protein JW923_01090 [Spirochaetales bacterium]|nr:hypothetical protein [Spirochaetales bacterium]